MLQRMLRALVPSGLLTETAGGEWVLTPLGEWLCPDRQGSLHPVAIYASEPWMRGAWDSLEHGLRTGGVPFENANGVPYFDYLDHNPEARRVFDSVMATRNSQRLSELATAYDWARFRHIVDVGGGQGILLFGLLRAHPALIGTVFDLPEVAAVAERYAVWEGLEGRIEAVGGNFFSDNPPCGDALILSRILNDWSDKACVRILRNCRAAISASGELLVLERVIEDGIGQRAEKESRRPHACRARRKGANTRRIHPASRDRRLHAGPHCRDQHHRSDHRQPACLDRPQ
jgi:hypothetical protein